MEHYFDGLWREMLDDGTLNEALCNYDGPQGKDTLLTALAALLRKEFDWPITAANIALTNGSQSAFFYLFNLFAGRGEDGTLRRVLFPLAPEYLGYSDAGLEENMCVATKPTLSLLPDGQFKYHVDFAHLKVGEDIGLICVSRPTNPTGNVITDEELMKLDALARQHQVPLLIDNAYGLPFPGLIFTDARPLWNPNIILCMSLSKLGLLGVRGGIVIAGEPVIKALSNINGIISLAPGGIGPVMLNRMIRRGGLLRLCEEVIRPFYRRRVDEAIACIRRWLPPERCLIHKPEGAIFLWLWFPDLPISIDALYQRLKLRGVLMVPGHYFFPGLEQEWHHSRQCLCMNYVPEAEKIERGIAILAEEVARAHRETVV